MGAELLRLTVTDNPFVPDRGGLFPSPKQAYFLTAAVLEALYGGAAGSGKSDAILAGALQYVDQPGYAALILRRTFADLKLPGALMDRAAEWLNGTDARWNDNDHQWVFPGGATLTFGYLENERDKYRYQSSEFQYIGLDELTQFTLTQYTYLFSRLRRLAGVNIPLRVRGASNPGGVGHDWVSERFPVTRHHGRPTMRHGRLFVPALLEENPGLDREAYEGSLAELDPVTRAQLRHGDWSVRPEGNLFKREWFAGKVIDSPLALARTVRFWDLAATEPSPANPDPDYTASVKMGDDGAGGFVVADVQEFRATPAERNRRMRATAELDGPAVEQFVEQEPGSAGVNTIDQMRREVFRGYACYGVRSTGDKITRAKPFSAACETGLVRLVRGSWLGTFIDRLCGFGLPGVHDDVTDAASSAHRQLTGDTPWTEDGLARTFGRRTDPRQVEYDRGGPDAPQAESNVLAEYDTGGPAWDSWRR